MKNLITKISICAALIFPACCFATGQNEVFQAVETERIPSILRSISKQTKENFERIHTWRGKLVRSMYFANKGNMAKETFETLTDANGPYRDEVVEITENIIIFKIDLGNGLLYFKRSREVPSRYIDPATNEDLGTKSVPSSSSIIITNEYRYNSEPIAYMNDVVAQRKAVKTKIEEPLYIGRQPNYLPKFIFDIDSQLLEKYPEYYAKIIEEKGEFVFMELAMKAEQRTFSGDLQYRIHEPFYMNAFNIKGWLINTYSEKAGYNIIDSKRITTDGELMWQKSTEYQKINGVYVPITETEDIYRYESDFSLRTHNEGVFKNILINEPIPAETFTISNLGLQDGDIFVDKTIDKEFKYENGALVETAQQ